MSPLYIFKSGFSSGRRIYTIYCRGIGQWSGDAHVAERRTMVIPPIANGDVDVAAPLYVIWFSYVAEICYFCA